MIGVWLLGFRHGFDPDHVAAITDIAGSQLTRRRALGYCTLYAIGHALVVVALGVGLALIGFEIPDAGRLIGATLVIMGVYVLWQAANGRRPASRAHLLQGAYRRLRLQFRRKVVVDHSHAHDDRHGHVHEPGAPTEATVGTPGVVQTMHTHAHRHVGFAPYGWLATVGVGVVHGIGAETPTQVIALSAGTWSLGPFILGLFIGNTVVAAVAAGLLARGDIRVLNIAVGVFSLAIGIRYVLGADPFLTW